MIVQEDIPYTKEEVKAMIKTIHDLREKYLCWVGILQVSRQKKTVSMLYFVMGLIYLLRQSIASISMNGATVMLSGGAIHRRRSDYERTRNNRQLG